MRVFGYSQPPRCTCRAQGRPGVLCLCDINRLLEQIIATGKKP